MEIISSGVVIATIDQPFRLFLCLMAIEADERGNIELQTDVHIAETLVVTIVHIAITLGMGKENVIALMLYARENVPEIDGRVVIACLDKQLVGIVANGQEVATLKTFLEDIVEHVLGSKRQLDGAGIS